MIFKIEFSSKTEFAQAKDEQDLTINYISEYGREEFLSIAKIIPISDEEAKTIMLKNTDESTYDEMPEFSLYDTVFGDDFCIVGSTEWD